MTVHATPAHGEAVTPCCDVLPRDLPGEDHCTLNPAAITCTTNHADGGLS